MKKLFLLSFLLSTLAFSHSGRLDSSGGHWNRKTGEYHYHRKPSSSYSITEENNQAIPKPKVSKTTTEIKNTKIKKITPKKLMSDDEIYTNLLLLGYRGDNAIYDFQRDNGLVSDGIAGSKTIQILK